MNKTELNSLLNNHVVVIYDGICGFCNAFIQFILDRKPSKKLKFVSFQSELGMQIVEAYQLSNDLSTIIVIENTKLFLKSRGFFVILKYIESNYKALHYFKIIPRIITDFFYDIIAKNRYLLMGKVEQCRLLSKKERAYFL